MRRGSGRFCRFDEWGSSRRQQEKGEAKAEHEQGRWVTLARLAGYQQQQRKRRSVHGNITMVAAQEQREQQRGQAKGGAAEGGGGGGA